MNRIQVLLSELISFQSITPSDRGCQNFMIAFLENIGFKCQRLDNGPVANFFAIYGHSGPLLVFAGHTDVVPVGNAEQWNTDPFKLTEVGNLLYGRGTADMKGSLACMLLMAERFVKEHSLTHGRLGFLITSGEEGEEYHLGTPFVMAELAKQNIHIDYCVVGEPSSTHQTGDVIKIGRRGSLNGKITIKGIQGHVAYPHLADNPIHKCTAALAKLSATEWDQGNSFFPPTSMQITSIHSGCFATNIIPAELKLQLNFRFSTEHTSESLQVHTANIFKEFQLDPDIEWRLSGVPFLTSSGDLLRCAQQAVYQISNIHPELSTSGGTSDGRFIAPYGVEVIELGPINATIHQVNECVSLSNLIDLEAQYYLITQKLLLELAP